MKFSKKKSAFDINYDGLRRQGYRAVMFDLDNTLVPDGALANLKASNLIKRLHKLGFKICVLSNNSSYKRVHDFEVATGVDLAVYKARKPFLKGFNEAMQVLEVKPEETVFIGDRVFTDMLGGLRAGLYTILVSPIDKSTDGPATRSLRKIEKPIRGTLNLIPGIR